MNFFKIDKLEKNNLKIIQADGLDVTNFVKILENLSKDEKFKNLDMNIDFFISKNYKFQGLSKSNQLKTLSYAIAENSQIFEVIDNKSKDIFFAVFMNKKLYVSSEKNHIEDVLEKELDKINSLNDTDKKVWNWLENGNTGQSSLTVCAHLCSHLNHQKLHDIRLSGFTYPHDLSDFKRCHDFLKIIANDKVSSVDVLKEMIEKDIERKIPQQWYKLIDNWQEIDKYVTENNLSQARELLTISVENKKGNTCGI